MSALDAAWWPALKPHLRLEVYDRDGGHSHPRFRIEVRESPPPALLAVTMPCVACGATIHPVRTRTGGGCYFAATCPLDVRLPCSRGVAVREEYQRIKHALEAA